jgi:hypothetical protein
VWGTSFAGMHATVLAASDHRLAGAIAQCPLVDGLAGSRLVRPTRSIALFATAIIDRVGSLFGRAHLSAGQCGTRRMGHRRHIRRTIRKEGHDAARAGRLAQPDGRAITAQHPRPPPSPPRRRHQHPNPIPILLIAAEHDTQAPVGPALAMAARAPRAELPRSTGGHYDDGGAAFNDVIEWEVEFLRHHARSEPSEPPS